MLSERDELEQTLAARDPDRYVAAFFAPSDKRRDLLGLLAFENEIAAIAHTVKEPMAGQIKLSWWRDQLDAIYGGGSVHAPVLRALAEVVRNHNLPREQFDACLEAREYELEDAPFADEAALDRYADAVFGGMTKLALLMLGAGQGADAAALAAGRAIARAIILREFSAARQRRRCRIPCDWLVEAGFDTSLVSDASAADTRMTPVFERLKSGIQRELAAMNTMRIPRLATPALAFASCARWEAKPSFNAWHPKPLPDWQRVMRITFANFAWRF